MCVIAFLVFRYYEGVYMSYFDVIESEKAVTNLTPKHRTVLQKGR